MSDASRVPASAAVPDAPHAASHPGPPPGDTTTRARRALDLPAPGSAGPWPLRTRWRWHVGVVLLVAVCGAWQSGLWTGDLGERLYLGPDPSICAWLQTTVSENLLSRPWDVFAGNVYYPQPDPVVYANAQLGSALLVLPLRLLTSNPILLDNAGTLLALVAVGYASFLLAWWLWGDPKAALVPAIAVTFAPHQLHHLTHLNMQLVFGLPLMALGVFQLLDRPRLGAALLAAAGFAVEVLSCAYYGVAAALLGASLGLCGLARIHRRRAWGHVVAAAALGALLCWPYLRAFSTASLVSWGAGSAGSGGIVLVLPRDLVRSDAWLWSGLLPERGDSAFAGFAVLVLGIWGVVRGRASFHARTLAFVAAGFLLLSLGRQVGVGDRILTLPYAWLQDAVPLLQAGRHPVSFVVVYLFALGMLAALGAREIGATRGRLRPALLVGLVILELASPPPRREGRPALPAVYAAVSRLEPRGPLFELPFDSHDQQLWAASHGLQTANGMLPHAPPEWLTVTQWFHEDLKVTPARDVSDRRSLIYLRARFPVRYLVAHPDTPAAWVRNIEATPAVFEPVLEVEGARVYRIHRNGAGRRLRRDYRGEDVTHGLDLVVRGPAGHVLVVEQDAAELARAELSPVSRGLHVRPASGSPRALVRLELRAEPEAEFELLGIEPAPAPSRP